MNQFDKIGTFCEKCRQVMCVCASKPELTEIPASEVRKQRPMYMNRLDAIKVITDMPHPDYKDMKAIHPGYAEHIIDTLIEAGHLTNPEGNTNVLTETEMYNDGGDKCGGCHQYFASKVNYCPNCGVRVKYN